MSLCMTVNHSFVAYFVVFSVAVVAVVFYEMTFRCHLYPMSFDFDFAT